MCIIAKPILIFSFFFKVNEPLFYCVEICLATKGISWPPFQLWVAIWHSSGQWDVSTNFWEELLRKLFERNRISCPLSFPSFQLEYGFNIWYEDTVLPQWASMRMEDTCKVRMMEWKIQKDLRSWGHLNVTIPFLDCQTLDLFYMRKIKPLTFLGYYFYGFCYFQLTPILTDRPLN